ncbi:MAG TPA: hypothetical protein VLA01_00830 [Nitrosopumilaceae archaeon]|nr:hypothetical protein [Nitrosopumilaceae archaeon]
MKGITSNGSVPASPWDMSNWFNWYWWLPDAKTPIDEEEISKTESPAENIDSIEEEVFPKEEEITQETKSTEAIPEKPKPKRKKRTVTKKVSTKSQDAIELILRPTVLEELEKEAIITDSTINQVIQVILEAHIDSKGADNTQTEVWTCNYCEPIREFRDYFEFSEHFFNLHMQPGLQKIEEFKKEQ